MMNKKILISIILATLVAISVKSFAEEKLRVVVPPDEGHEMEHVQYFYKLLDLSLSKTAVTDGDFEIVKYPQAVSFERYLQSVKAGTIDVIWANINKEREINFLPIHISILKDLNSYRIFLIRKEDQPLFDAINSLSDLKKLLVGQGSTWPDTAILRNNNFRVITAVRQDTLIKMLAFKRFDFFPRGLSEVWREASDAQSKNIVIEKHLMLFYESPIYFFVNKDNKKLADRIERGLKIAISDGSFDHLFFGVNDFKRGYEEQKNSPRILFKLDEIADQTTSQ